MIPLKVDIMFFRFSAFKTHLSTFLSLWVVLIFFRSIQALSLTSLLSSIFLSPSLSHLSLPYLSSFIFILSPLIFLLIFHSQSLSYNIPSSLSFLSSLTFSRFLFLFLSLSFYFSLISSLFVFHSFIYHLAQNFGSLPKICFFIPSLALSCFRTCRMECSAAGPV